ncbi:hypothetical protein M011DRAFT_471055 [Sporormia fimetaria CBS 119925]|uniref:Uncharacterized protein n=1 Tax=Sporormia fimetaria CBS 119925 TaxID=1340428 RepID=A0A6A6V269_9PLEO|nr:hypothetical protein M011DRAFT_471055 [Sporormia fimetaria CBS 119925]
MRRLQANLAYLVTLEGPRKAAPGPAMMSIPTSLPELTELYTKLQALFPGWNGAPGPHLQSMSGQPQNSVLGSNNPGSQQQQNSPGGLHQSPMMPNNNGIPGMTGGPLPPQLKMDAQQANNTPQQSPLKNEMTNL